eukprot:gene18770-20661_t
MPRSVRSLNDAVLRCIAINIKHWADMIPEYADSYLYVISPFDILDYGLTQKVFDALIKYNTFQQKHIHLLFHPNIDSINFSKCDAYRLADNTLKILFSRCKRIKSIVMSPGQKFSASALSSIPLHYHNLQRLEITHEGIRDDLISNLASNCPNLYWFQSGTCCNITDNALRLFTKLQKLRVLLLGNADRLSAETLMLILNSCRQLYQLSLPMTLLNFKFLDSCNVFHSIAILDLTLSPVDDESVGKIAVSFLNLRDLCLSNCVQVTTQSLVFIANNCKHIEKLNLSYSGIEVFTSKLERALQIIGHGLHVLDISGMRGVRTSFFGRYCKQLHKLFMNHCAEITTDWVEISNEFDRERSASCEDHSSNNKSLPESCPCLTTLQVDARNKLADGDVFYFEPLLRNGHFISLALTSIPGFSDAKLQKMIDYMNCNRLQQLNLSGNENITHEGIWLAIESFVDLQTIKIMDCDVVAQEYKELQKRLNRKGYNIQIIW